MVEREKKESGLPDSGVSDSAGVPNGDDVALIACKIIDRVDGGASETEVRTEFGDFAAKYPTFYSALVGDKKMRNKETIRTLMGKLHSAEEFQWAAFGATNPQLLDRAKDGARDPRFHANCSKAMRCAKQ